MYTVVFRVISQRSTEEHKVYYSRQCLSTGAEIKKKNKEGRLLVCPEIDNRLPRSSRSEKEEEDGIFTAELRIRLGDQPIYPGRYLSSQPETHNRTGQVGVGLNVHTCSDIHFPSVSKYKSMHI